MASSVSICSNALLLLGAQTINDFDENDDRAKLASNLYEQTRDDVLRRHSWNCCINRVVLSPSTTAPVFGYGYKFKLPGDCLRVLSVSPKNYRIEGGYILANCDTVHLRYVFRNQDESTYDSTLISLIELAMAARMAYPITGSASLRDSFMQEFEFKLRQAKAIDGQEEPPAEIDGFPLMDSRYG